MCIILVANIIGALATQYIRPFIWISPLSIRVADVSSQFSTSQLYNMIVLAALFGDTFWPPNRTFRAQKSGQELGC